MAKIILEPGGYSRRYWHDVWAYRELFYTLAWRDLAVRYKQTAIGASWAVIRPLLTTLIFTIIFSRIAKLPTPEGIPYPLLVMTAMIPWQFVATSLSEASNSLIGNSILISKTYFPRLIVPAGAVMTSFVDFLITIVLLGVLMAWYGSCPDWRILACPCFIGLAFGVSLGAGLWLCALNVEYRDFRYIVPFIVQFGVYVSPVGFSSSIVPGDLRLIYSLNPMVGIIDGFRWALLRGETAIYWPNIFNCVIVTFVLCLSGFRYFRKVERSFADVI
jgi:lipopolysaccharide transport system permease protein